MKVEVGARLSRHGETHWNVTARCLNEAIVAAEGGAMERRRTALLVHGFASDGAQSTHRLAPYFERAGYMVYLMDYNWTGLVGVRLCNAKIARAISQLVPPGTVGVGHSNGCAILAAASLYGARFAQLVFLNPALDVDAEVGPQVGRVHVWTAQRDRAVWLSKFLVAHPWGDMGSKGYRGSDSRFVNHGMSVEGHNAVFEPEWLGFYGPLMVGEVERWRLRVFGRGGSR